MICAFIDAERGRFGVVPICRALSAHGIQIAPRTFWARRSAAAGKRQLWDTAVTEILAGIYEPDSTGRRPPESLYGTVKMWAHLNRQGIPVAKCTVERLKRAHGWRGATRGRRVRTTVPDPAAARAPDLVRRQFKAPRPGQLHVADFTYSAQPAIMCCCGEEPWQGRRHGRGGAHNHRPWRKARSWSPGRNRVIGVPGSSRCRRAASLAARSASRY